MKVNGLELPKKLQKLLLANKWVEPDNINSLLASTKIHLSSKMRFYTLEVMRDETDIHHLTTLVLEEDLASYYGLGSSRLEGNPITIIEKLDIDYMVSIASNYDEEGICLDYRDSLDEPRVMMSSVHPINGTKWIEIAKDFDTFLIKFNIVEP